MSSEILGGAENLLKGNLGGAWDIKHGYADAYTDLGIARTFGGPAAAYSLRDIGAMNGRVVKVRRDQDDPDGSTNDPEEDFSAHQISTGILEDWINGKLETALPCNVGSTNFESGSFVVSNSNNSNVNGTYTFNSSNSRWEKTSTIYFHLDSSTWTIVVGGSSVAATTNGEYPWTSTYSLVSSNISFGIQFSSIVFSTAAAAYSLRKVRNGYTGNVVHIRRGSDDTEVNVAFDSEDKVSASSSISLVSGSTNATDLNGFLNEKLTVGTAVNGTGSFNNYTVTNATTTGFSADNSSGGTGSAGFPYIFAEDDIIVVKYTVSNFSSTSSLSPQIRGTTGTNSVTSVASGGTTFTANGTYTDTLTATGDGTHLMFADGNTGSYTISDFEIVSHTHQAFVNTWYDQGGANNAVQETAANQPKIASAGALLADGLTFDGTNDFLQTTSQVLTGTEAGANSMYAVIKQTSGDAGYICGSAANTSGSDQIGQSLYGASNDKIVLTNGNDATATGTLDTVTRIEGSNYLVSSNYSNNNTDTLHSNANAFGYADGSSAYDFNAGDRFTIGARKDSTSAAAVLFTGSMKEIIAYNSDQTDNRFRIESNINNYYNLYNDEYEWHSSNTEWQNSVTTGSTTFSASGKDGFTITATGENIANFKFAYQSPSTATDNYYKVSFMVDDPNGLFDTAQLRTSATGSGATAQSIVNGFNSLKLKAPANGNFVSLNIDAGGSEKTATLSNFKASLINRNGYVETLYDQSGNHNHADQATAASQPGIVLNGGQVKIGNRASMQFDGSNDFLDRATYTQGDLSQTNTAFAVAKLRVFVDDNQKVFDGHNSTKRNMIQLNPISNGQFAAYAGVVRASGEDADANQHLFESRFSGDASRFVIDGVVKNTGSQGAQAMEGINIGTNHDAAQNFWDGDIQEIIIYNSDLFNDRAEIENEINDYYTIY